MCGIAGRLSSPDKFCPDVPAAMAATLHHRGPDDSGVWSDPDRGIALAHRRLSILDLSPEGHQPMHSACGRYVIVFNGEIYNHGELKSKLLAAGHGSRKTEIKHPIPSTQPLVFRGHSDTEILLTAISQWGLERTLAHSNGMFAFALWDREAQTLTLVRDRLGKKPLCFGWVAGGFAFASELKALRAIPGFDNPIDRDALTLYFRHNCIPEPYSIYRGIHKLPPGTSLTLDLERALKAGCFTDVSEHVRPYWSARTIFEAGQVQPFTGSEGDILADLDLLLRDAVAMRMVADVPLGAFLSGGIDSSLVVALMQVQAAQPVKTFTIGFDEAAHNEAEEAKRVAQHLGTEHFELFLSPQVALDVVPRLPALYDEPFADSSQIPTFLVSTFARSEVTVALSGDGGDELFGGYNRYLWAPRLWQKMSPWPLAMRRMAAKTLDGISPKSWEHLASMLGVSHRTPADKIQKIVTCLNSASPGDIYRTLVSHWENPKELVVGGHEPATRLAGMDEDIDQFGFTQAMIYADTVGYLPDDILVKVDRASMGVSLEARAPLLDYRVAEFAARVPLALKIRGGQGKYLLRQLLYRYVPKELVERPKMGFEMPIAAWLRGPLRDWAEDLIDERRLREDGYLDPAPIRIRWQEHLAGRRNWQFHLWDVLMFQAWREAVK